MNHELLTQRLTRLPGVRAAMISSKDGVILEKSFPADLELSDPSTLVANLTLLLSAFDAPLGRGLFFVCRCERLQIAAARLGEQLLILLTQPDLPPGVLRSAVKASLGASSSAPSPAPARPKDQTQTQAKGLGIWG